MQWRIRCVIQPFPAGGFGRCKAPSGIHKLIGFKGLYTFRTKIGVIYIKTLIGIPYVGLHIEVRRFRKKKKLKLTNQLS